jgi:hypothetical protein
MPPRLSPALQWAFQLQSIAAVAPGSDDLGASLADIGILIGLHLAPAALALPGRPVGQR